MPDMLPVVPWIVIDAAGPYVEARRCDECEAVMTSPSLACPSCGRRGTMKVYRVVDTGRLHSWSIVHRSFPGVEVPFVSAVVDMDDGTVLKGNLRKIAPLPDAVAFDMKIKLVFDDAGRKDASGNVYTSYFFEAA